MRRFNQAWLVDQKNAAAIWGLAAVSSNDDRTFLASLGLFAEAEKLLPDDVDFAVDYAKAMGTAGALTGSEPLMAEADKRYASIYKKVPNYTLNIQNWAIVDYIRRDYKPAWRKIVLAEATPQKADIDMSFIKALEAKMPRPTN